MIRLATTRRADARAPLATSAVTSVVALLASALAGCASTSMPGGETAPQAMPDDRARAESALAERLGSALQGDTMKLRPGNPLGAERVTLEGGYAAASGSMCRRVVLDGGASSRRIVCRDAVGRWSLPRSLDAGTQEPAFDWTRENRSQGSPSKDMRVIVPADGSAGATSDDNGSHSSFDLEPSETLWHFAFRTTGDGQNWSVIARINDIEDTHLVHSGTTLEVPTELVVARTD